MKLKELLFGTAGIPLRAKGIDTVGGVAEVRKLGLDAMELEFVHSVNISEEKAPEVKKAAEKENIVLSCHAPYYINLNATDSKKIHASEYYIYKSAKILDLCGGWSVAFHPGFYMKMEKNQVYENVKKQLSEIVKKCKNEGIKVWLRPETTGKPTQFGDLDEILKLSQELEQVMPCIDFGHMHAREGKNNTFEEFKEILSRVEKALGKEGLNNMHIQAAGIVYGEKGEKSHTTFADSDLNYKDMIRAWKEFKIKGVAISESSNVEGDALIMKKLWP